MRLVGFAILGCLFVSPTLAHAQQRVAGDFDGDGRSDTVGWFAKTKGCALRVTLAAKPDEALTLIESGGTPDCPEAGAEIEVRPGGSYAVKDFRGERPMTFAHDIILSARRPGVRSVKYWNGTAFVGIWISD